MATRKCIETLNGIIHDIDTRGDAALDCDNTQKIYDVILPEFILHYGVDTPYGLDYGDVHNWIDSLGINCSEDAKGQIYAVLID